ncbi:MAG: helix-turn-helix domain-containing protein [Desulfomonilaceae bacterium]
MERPRIALRLCADELQDVRKLRAIFEKAGKHSLDLRLRAVLLVSQGTPIKQTAGMCGVGTTTVRGWLTTYREKGLWTLISSKPYHDKKPGWFLTTRSTSSTLA